MINMSATYSIIKYPAKGILLLNVLFLFLCGAGDCQSDTAKHAYDDLSLKDLLNIKIVSVSKQSETLLDAPLSASVLTKDDIRKAGCTSIMEALRLVPGMIVREQSNGNYDIHLRGMDNVPPNAPFDVTSNTTTLVMIDNRSVSSYLRGGTFWETLPIDLNDVEKIEVVRGPAAALYGPNAVNGVINIITRHASKDGLYLVANTQQGSNLTFINNASVGYRFNKMWNMIASGNYQSRDRTQQSYFEFNRNKWLQNPEYFLTFNGDTIHNVDQRYPDQPLAMDKYAGNLFVNYEPAEKAKFNLSVGSQHSEVTKVSTENDITPFSTASSNSRYADFRASVKGLSAQFSYHGGTQATDADPGNKYDFGIVDANVEYNYTKGNLSIKPGCSYTNAVYDDRKYSNTAIRQGLLNTRGQIVSRSASLRGEYKLLHEKLRLVAGIAANGFNYPDNTFISHQFAATYKPDKNHLFRIVYSRAPRSSNIFDTYVDQAMTYSQTGNRSFTETAVIGNKNLKLLTADMLEVGYRGNITPHLSVDVELFSIGAKNYSVPVQSHPVVEFDGIDTVYETPNRLTNLPMRLLQNGITVSVIWNSKKLLVKPFVTGQQTVAKDYAPFINTPDAGTPNAAQNNIYSGMGASRKLNNTPAVFGGAFVNYTVTPKINVNVNAYYYTAQTYYHVSNIIFNDGVRGIDHINAKLILNTTISYEPSKNILIFCSGKNILNDNSREFFKTDAVPFMLLAGLKYEF
jgi:iron complex outermembrane receptor protein